MARISRKEVPEYEPHTQDWFENLIESQRTIYSNCHYYFLQRHKIFMVNDDGSENPIGHADVCSFRDRTECNGIERVWAHRRRWPENLNGGIFMALCDKKPPGLWLSFGYHVQLRGGKWFNIRQNNYEPLNNNLNEKAKNLIRMKRKFYKAETPKNLSGMLSDAVQGHLIGGDFLNENVSGNGPESFGLGKSDSEVPF